MFADRGGGVKYVYCNYDIYFMGYKYHIPIECTIVPRWTSLVAVVSKTTENMTIGLF
jgi:hypothetical protein